MKFRNLFLIIFVFVSALGTTKAQELKKGYFKYEITDFKAANPNDPQMNMVENMIKGTITKLYFDGKKAFTKINSMGGMQVIKMLVNEDGSTDMYMDVMGQKIHTKITKEDMEKLKKEQGEKKPEYIHHKDKTKKILGYTAHLVTVKDDGMDDNQGKIELWVTDDIKTDAIVQQGMDNKEIGGFPLEYTITIKDQFSMTTKATEFKKDFDNSVFDFDKSGYKDMDMDQLKNMGGGF